MKRETFPLNLKTANEIKAFNVEMEFDEDTGINKFLMLIDGERIELSGDTESIFVKLSRILNGQYEIQSCFTCRYGNFCPWGDIDNEIFCISDFEPKSKNDLFFLYNNSVEMKSRHRTLFDICEKFLPCSDDYWTYK